MHCLLVQPVIKYDTHKSLEVHNKKPIHDLESTTRLAPYGCFAEVQGESREIIQ